MALLKKTLAAAMASVLLGSASAASAAIAAPNGPRAPQGSKELRALAGLELKVLRAIDSATKAELAKIRDPKMKKTYGELAKAKREGMRSIFADIRSASRYSYGSERPENFRNAIKLSAKSSLQLIREMRAVNSNPKAASVSLEEKAKVESEIVGFQRDLLVNPAKAFLDAYVRDGIKETGEGKMSIETPYGKANVNVERYSSLLSMVGLAQESDFVVSGDFDLEVPGPSKYDPNTWERIPGEPVGIKGGAKIDANVKIVDKTAYVLIRDYSIDVSVSGSGSESAQKEMEAGLSQARVFMDGLKGKTVSIRMPQDDFGGYGNDAAPEKLLSKFREILSVLETSSTLTPERKISEGTYALGLNPKTFARLAKASGGTVTQGEFKRTNLEFLASGVTYSNADGKASIASIAPNGEGTFSLSKTTAGYSVRLETLSSRTHGIVTVTPEGASFTMDEGGNGIVANWKRGTGEFDLWVTEDEEAVFSVTGTVLMEKIDLSFVFQGKTVASLKVSKVGKTTESDLWISFEAPSMSDTETNAFTVRASGKSTVENGNFTVEVPTDAIDLESLLGIPSREGSEESQSILNDSIPEATVLSVEKIAALKKGAYLQGAPNPTILAIEYSDPECPFCIRQGKDAVLAKLMKAYPELAVAHKPIKAVEHPGSEAKSVALLCVGKISGAKAYNAYYDAIMKGSTVEMPLSVSKLSGLAKDLGVGTEKFAACTANKETAGTYDANTAEANAYGAYGTPTTLIVNVKTGKYELVEGAYPYENFKEAVERVRK